MGGVLFFTNYKSSPPRLPLDRSSLSQTAIHCLHIVTPQTHDVPHMYRTEHTGRDCHQVSKPINTSRVVVNCYERYWTPVVFRLKRTPPLLGYTAEREDRCESLSIVVVDRDYHSSNRGWTSTTFFWFFRGIPPRTYLQITHPRMYIYRVYPPPDVFTEYPPL